MDLESIQSFYNVQSAPSKDYFQNIVFKKTGLNLKKTALKQYKFIPFVGKNAYRNHFFMRPNAMLEHNFEMQSKQNIKNDSDTTEVSTISSTPLFPAITASSKMDSAITSIVLHDTIGSVFSTLNKFSDEKEPLLNAHCVITQKDGAIVPQNTWPNTLGLVDLVETMIVKRFLSV